MAWPKGHNSGLTKESGFLKTICNPKLIMIQMIFFLFIPGIFSQNTEVDNVFKEKMETKIEYLKRQLVSFENRSKAVAKSKDPLSSEMESLNQSIKQLTAQIDELEKLKIKLGMQDINLLTGISESNSQRIKIDGKSANPWIDQPIFLKRVDFLSLPPDKQRQILEMKSVYTIVD